MPAPMRVPYEVLQAQTRAAAKAVAEEQARLDAEQAAMAGSRRIQSALGDLDLGTDEGITKAYERLIPLVLEGVVPPDKGEFARRCFADLLGRKRGVTAEGVMGAVLEALLVPRARPQARLTGDSRLVVDVASSK
jgi:hypothetical protein